MTVFINGKGAHRMGDQNRHCGGMGQLVEGSSNVIVGESGGDGGGRGGDGGGDSDGNGNGNGDNDSGGSGSGSGNDDNSISFLELSLVDRNYQPVAGQRYRVTMPDGGTREGALDNNGKVRIDGIKPGTCQVFFPDLAADV